jgi:hypothetical protein
MRLLAVGAASDGEIRRRIEDYFREGELAPLLEPLLEESRVDFARWCAVLSELTAAEEGELRGTTARYLESYPDQPGLLLGRALAELMDGSNEYEFSDNLDRSLVFALQRYGLGPTELRPAFEFLLRKAEVFTPKWRPLIWTAWNVAIDENGSDALQDLEDATFSARGIAAAELVVLLLRRIRRLSRSTEEMAQAHTEVAIA